ncbi:MAG: hypothetical protein IJ455_00430 [Agathobacter sp.]|nr:hypothetical protein [Agathobacter sp.]
MKRYISVFEMITRSSIYKVLLILVGMVSAEAISFYSTFQKYSETTRNVEEYIQRSDYDLIFKIAYVLITIVIVLPGMNLGSTQSYTLQRLRIKEKRIFWLQALYNTMAYVLLWGAQLVTILVSVLVYRNNLPKGATWNNQSVFLLFYENDFMHSILPLEDSPGWWVLGFLIVGTALVAAEFTKQQRRGKFAFEILLLVVAMLISFPRDVGYEFTFLAISLCIVYIIMGMRWILNKVDDGGE